MQLNTIRTRDRFLLNNRNALFAGIVGAALALPVAASAQDARDEKAVGPENFSDNVVIVTATKREKTLQKTPISVSVTSGETVEQAQIRDVLDLQTVVPSLRVSQQQNSSNTTFIIRGFGNGANNFGIEPSVGVFIDGVFRSRTAGALGDLPTVDRIEVLNGPQSTLFGKNASAGVVSVVTRKPQFDFGGSVEASYGNYNAITLKGEVTGPISDTIAFSIGGSYNNRDGYSKIVNLDRDLNDRNRSAVRGQLLFEPTTDLSIRAIGDYSRIDETCCTVGNILNGPTGAVVFALGGAIDPENLFSYHTYLNQEPLNQVDNYGGSLQIDWKTGPLAVTSISSYRKLKNFYDQDVDFTSTNIVSELRDQDAKTLTQELRVTSDFDGPVNFLLGGFYYNEKIDQISSLATGTQARSFFELLGGSAGLFSGVEADLGLPQGSIFAPGLLTSEDYSMDNTSWSLFGTVDFEPFDGLVLTGGFNYTKDKKDFALSQTSYDPLSNINLVDAYIVGSIAQALMIPPNQVTPDVIQGFATNPATAPFFPVIAGQAVDPTVNPLLALQPFQIQPPFLNIPNAVEDGRTRDGDWSYILRAAYDVSDRMNVYVSYATGFKASSVNLSRDSRPNYGDFIPGAYGSTILAPSSPVLDAGLAVPNLTTGSRFAGPEHAKVWEIGAKAQFPGVSLNLALFDQTLNGFQDFLFTGTGFQLSNAGKQSVKGFEFDATITPADPLILTFAVTHLDPEYKSFVDSPVGDLSGLRAAGIPSWAIATSATYTHEFDDSARLIGRVDYSHESSTQILNGLTGFGDNATNQAIARNYRREVNLVNASVTLKLPNGFELGAWARNLLNDHYISTMFSSTAQAGSISGYPNAPRTYGGVIRFTF